MLTSHEFRTGWSRGLLALAFAASLSASSFLFVPAAAAATDSEVESIFQGILVAEEMLNAAESALATLGGAGVDASVDGNEELEVGSDDGQPSLNSNNPLSAHLYQYDNRLGDRTGYTTDTGSNSGGKTGESGSAADDLWEGSPTGSALD